MTAPLSPARTAPHHRDTVLRLFCVPHAGGSARAFRDWHRHAPPGVEVVPLEPAGRGARAGVPAARSVREAARDFAATVRAVAGRTPYVLLGHSMGALIAYEMVAAGEPKSLPEPALVVVSGRNPPHHQPAWTRRVLGLSDGELLAELRSLGSVPSGLSPSIAARFFLPAFRADLRMTLGHEPGERPWRTAPPLLVLMGRQDPLVEGALMAEWGLHTVGSCTVVRHDGGHFALYDRVPWLMELIGSQLRRGEPGSPVPSGCSFDQGEGRGW
ncbi:thioesterase II family protein [Streptomyces sp. NPDC087850]|uniref:thioesterase II family protein n=1 Tax=unclassified Streptomyces TaxID=2593676 RepID=UPI00381C5AF0